jgi:hypothetical protein
LDSAGEELFESSLSGSASGTQFLLNLMRVTSLKRKFPVPARNHSDRFVGEIGTEKRATQNCGISKRPRIRPTAFSGPKMHRSKTPI